MSYDLAYMGKSSFLYSAVSSPLGRSKRFLPSLTDLFIPTPFSASPGSILARQQLRAKTTSLTFPPLSIAMYTFIQLSQQGRQLRERKCPIFETVAKGDSNPGSLDCESGILPLSYRLQINLPAFSVREFTCCEMTSRQSLSRLFLPSEAARHVSLQTCTRH